MAEVVNGHLRADVSMVGGAGTCLMEHNGTFRKSGNFHAPTLSITRITKKYHGTFRNMPWGPPTPTFFQEKYPFQKKYQFTRVYLSTFTKDTPT